MEIRLDANQEAFIAQQIAAGHYESASDVVSIALQLMDEILQDREFRISDLRAAMKEGEEDLERGDYVSLGKEDIPAFFNQLLADALAKQERKAS